MKGLPWRLTQLFLLALFRTAVSSDDHEWVVGPWEACSVTCGGGRQGREIFCAEKTSGVDGTAQEERRKVDESFCVGARRPEAERPCATQRCPVWEVGEWGACSATCGSGVKVRKVACQQERNREMARHACDPKAEPDSKLPCLTGITCMEAQKNKMADYERYRYVAGAPFTQWDEGSSDDGRMGGMMGSGLGGLGGMGGPGGGGRPSWMPGQWSECSRSCGAGVRTRAVECGAWEPLTRRLLRLPDYECQDGPKPAQFQPCELRPCPGDSAPDPHPAPAALSKSGYSWEYGGWGPCSASCLGGKQKSLLRCVSGEKNRTVPWAYCDPRQRPVDMSKACNAAPCPPRWELGPWSVCSHSCGGGLRTRRVRCIREIARDRGTLILPDLQCGSARPSDRQPCALVDCPAQWVKGPWTVCSASCGQGEQRRQVSCQMRAADGKLRTQNPPRPCTQPAPPDLQLCSLGDCPPGPTNPRAAPPTTLPPTTQRPINLQSTLKNFEQGQNHRRLTLRVGGRATLYEGTSVKLKCPVKNFDRSKIKWSKNGRPIEASRRMKVSRFGALRLFRAKSKDAGLYSCKAGELEGNITLIFKPHYPRHQPNRLHSNNVWKQRGRERPAKQRLTASSPAPDLASQLKALPQQSPEATKPKEIPQPKTASKTPTKHEGKTETKPAPKIPAGWVPSSHPLKDSEDSGKKVPSRGLIEELKDYLLRNQKLDVYKSLERISSASAIRTEWVEGEWSPCSQTCGEDGGMQFRSVQCKVDVKGYTSYVDDNICSEFGLSKPHEMRLCALAPCPAWVAGHWSDCANSRCLRFSTALQRRTLSCVLPNGTVVEEAQCSSKARPRRKKECFNEACVGKWRAGGWQPCSRTCGEGGVQMRVVRCVWGQTRKAAGDACQGADRPKLLRPCQPPPPCPDQPPLLPGPFKGCWDESRHCGVAKSLGLCERYGDRCCLSCTLPEEPLR